MCLLSSVALYEHVRLSHLSVRAPPPGRTSPSQLYCTELHCSTTTILLQYCYSKACSRKILIRVLCSLIHILHDHTHRYCSTPVQVVVSIITGLPAVEWMLGEK